MNNSEQPAFPLDPGKMPGANTGLTKREYFAAMAMQGIISAPMDKQLGDNQLGDRPDKVAELAVHYAYQLLKQLEAK